VGAAPTAKATGKELRAAIRRRLNGEGCQPVEDWLPRYLEFPTRGYTDRPVSEARAAYDKLARGWRQEGAESEASAEPAEAAPSGVEDSADERRAAAALDEAA
jgi:ParB family chromosome partitioning protein